MDRIGSNIIRTAQSIETLLKSKPILFQLPIGQGESFKGVIDLI